MAGGHTSTGFSRALEVFIAKANGNISLIFRRLALGISKDTIMWTPVDTGMARANWRPSLNSMESGILESAGGNSGEEAVANTETALQYYKAGDTFYLVNNLPYIRPLEYGSSKQAPRGMLRRAMAKGRREVIKEARALNAGHVSGRGGL